jgi:hypothetical protein
VLQLVKKLSILEKHFSLFASLSWHLPTKAKFASMSWLEIRIPKQQTSGGIISAAEESLRECRYIQGET